MAAFTEKVQVRRHTSAPPLQIQARWQSSAAKRPPALQHIRDCQIDGRAPEAHMGSRQTQGLFLHKEESSKTWHGEPGRVRVKNTRTQRGGKGPAIRPAAGSKRHFRMKRLVRKRSVRPARCSIPERGAHQGGKSAHPCFAPMRTEAAQPPLAKQRWC